MTNSTFSMEEAQRKSECPPKLIAFGNPLLDMSIEIKDNLILDQFGLNPEDQREISMEKLLKIVKIATATYGKPQCNPGGSALNTCRILCSLVEKDILFCGSIGDDENGEILQDILKKSSLNSCLQTINDYHTGTCICLINEDKRSLNANIGAALHFKKEFVQSKWCKSKIKSKYCNEDDSQIFYVEGFFVPEKLAVCKHIFETYCKFTNNILATNLNAPYILNNFTTEMLFLVENSDIVFGNRIEYDTLASLYGYKDIDMTAKYLVKQKSRVGRSKILVVTDGCKTVYLYYGNALKFHRECYKVPSIRKNLIIDTTGAGDSFVAGFLFNYMRKSEPLMDSVKFGCRVAAKVIREIGCNLPSPMSPTVLTPTN